MKSIHASYQTKAPSRHAPEERYFVHVIQYDDGAIVISSDDIDIEIPLEMVEKYGLTLSGIERKLNADVRQAAATLCRCRDEDAAARWLSGADRLTKAMAEAYMARFLPGGDYYKEEGK